VAAARNSGAGAVTPSFVANRRGRRHAAPAAPCSRAIPSKPSNTPNKAIPAIAMDNQLRLNLHDSRFMIINLAIGL